ncbi:MAG TPA: hypothetical protein VGJ12_13760, partial [Gemmatimonadaceae bacterium]
MKPPASHDATELPATLRGILVAAVHGEGTASVSVIARAGAEAETFWVPESASEPAFLAYSITK